MDRKALLAEFIRTVWSEGNVHECDRYLADRYIIHHDPGDYPGFPATQRPISMSGATVYYFDAQDRICGHWQITDRLAIFRQLQPHRGSDPPARASPG